MTLISNPWPLSKPADSGSIFLRNFYLIVLIISAIFQSSPTNALSESIRMGYFEISPHVYQSPSTGHAAGAAVHFFNRVAQKMGYDVEWIGPLPHARLVRYLEKGDAIDGDPIISMTSERKKFLSYPENHFYNAKPNFIVLKSNPLENITSADDVRGYVIGQFSEAAHSKFVLENKSLFKFDIIAAGQDLMTQHLNKLILKRVDAVHTLDEFSLLFEAKKLNLDDRIKVLFLPDPSRRFYSGFCKNKKGINLAWQYDIAIKELGLTPEHYLMFIRDEFSRLEKGRKGL